MGRKGAETVSYNVNSFIIIKWSNIMADITDNKTPVN